MRGFTSEDRIHKHSQVTGNGQIQKRQNRQKHKHDQAKVSKKGSGKRQVKTHAKKVGIEQTVRNKRSVAL